jgi:hypothetical protein
VDSDGTRFVVVCAEQYQPASSDWDVRASTYHLIYGSALGISEAREAPAFTGDTELRPRVTSTRSGGGLAYRYGIVWDRKGATPDINVEGATYDGVHSGGFNTIPTGCAGLAMGASGAPALGGTVTFNMVGSGPNTPVMMLSLPITPVTVCSGCQLGVSLGAASFFVGSVLNLPIPNEGAFVGGSVAVQGFSYGVGPCLSQITLSDTATCTVR